MKKKKLVTLYTKTLHAAGMGENNGVIQVNGSPLINGSKVCVLPTKEHIETMMEERDNAFIVVKDIMNPLIENGIKGPDFITRTVIGEYEDIFYSKLEMLFEAVLSAYEANINGKKFGMKLSTLLASIDAQKSKAVKTFLDDNMRRNLTKLFKGETGDPDMFKLVLKKKVKEDDEEHVAGSILYSPFKEHIEMNGDLNIKLRGKDKVVALALINYVLDTFKSPISTTDDRHCPIYTTLLQTMHNVDLGMRKVHALISEFSKEVADGLLMPSDIKAADIKHMLEYLPFAKEVPNTNISTVSRAPVQPEQPVKQSAPQPEPLPPMQPAPQPAPVSMPQTPQPAVIPQPAQPAPAKPSGGSRWDNFAASVDQQEEMKKQYAQNPFMAMTPQVDQWGRPLQPSNPDTAPWETQPAPMPQSNMMQAPNMYQQPNMMPPPNMYPNTGMYPQPNMMPPPNMYPMQQRPAYNTTPAPSRKW